MKLYTVPNNVNCEQVKSIVSADIEVVELKKNGEQWFEGDVAFPHTEHGFPVLLVGESSDGKPNYLVGKDGIVSFLEKGYVYAPDSKYCPYEKGNCRERDCVKFSILWKGIVSEGGCGDYWSPILAIELISKLNKD